MERYFHLFYTFTNLRSDCEGTANYGIYFIRVNMGVFKKKQWKLLFICLIFFFLEWSFSVFHFENVSWILDANES